MSSVYSIAFGIGSQNSQGQWLEVFYPSPLLKPAPALTQVLREQLDYRGGNAVIALDVGQCQTLSEPLAGVDHQQAALVAAMVHSQRPCVLTILAEDQPPQSVPEAYLKLQLISHRLLRPHQTRLDGIFTVLPNVAWTSDGAIALDDLPQHQWQARLAGRSLTVHCVDKFPNMTDYVVPTGVRIADTARVRLGAYIGEGTTIMHEGFVNFNAGTLGTSMVEGRISAGVVVGSGSDLGGGCSTMGTLSGGGNMVISVGNNCLIGANAGIGIPLGDRCTVEAGLYLTAGTKVQVLDTQGVVARTVKARELAGETDLLFRRNSLNGAVECHRSHSAIELNAALHAND